MSISSFDKQHLKDIAAIQRAIDNIFFEAIRQAAILGQYISPSELTDAIFRFNQFPMLKERIDALRNMMAANMQTTIVNGVRSQWTLANNKNNELCNAVFGKAVRTMSKGELRRYYSNNEKALEQFLKRKEGGMNLSGRVWNFVDNYQKELEMALDSGIRQGLSADEMSRDLRECLKYPDKLFRRVRDEHGDLVLSKAAKAFHSGQGVYRSSYMNARRLAATETNIAYRTADHERWKQLDFVVGIEVSLSNNHTCKGVKGEYVDICDSLQGKYPKDFKFTGWHPHCRCHAVPIMKTQAEMDKDNERIMMGLEPDESSRNSVTDMPKGFVNWMAENQDRYETAKERGTLPYFIKDNEPLIGFSDSE